MAATFVAADALLRRASAGDGSASWFAPNLGGALASQLAVELDLAREGYGRGAVDADAFATRVRVHDDAARAAVLAELATVGVVPDLEGGATDGAAAVNAARTAFVRLYETGVLTDEEAVVDVCPRCAVVLDERDVEVVAAETERSIVRLQTSVGVDVDVALDAPELLPGLAAVTVPADDHPAAGARATVPVLGVDVPVVAEPARPGPTAVVPAHDAADLALARSRTLAVVHALDDHGTVAEGPWRGLPRFAARAAAVEALSAAGALVTVDTAAADVRRCRACGTPVLPRAGRHWFLAADGLEAAVADELRGTDVRFVPPSARDELLAAAGSRDRWCVSLPLVSGAAVPVARCADCGRSTVSVEAADSCGTCMGALVDDGSVLDPRFVAALAPLVASGWPDDADGARRDAAGTVLLLGQHGVVRWALPMAALGCRLAGAVPFGAVAVHEPDRANEPADLGALADELGADGARAAALGDFDDRIEALVAPLLGG